MKQTQLPEKVLPGQPILPIYEPTDSSTSVKYIAGDNVRLETVTFDNSNIPTLVATTMGRVQITDELEIHDNDNNNYNNNDGNETTTTDDEKYKKNNNRNTKIVSVISLKDPKYKQGYVEFTDVKCQNYKAVTPQVNDIVLARVTKLTHLRINVEILSVLPKQSEEESSSNNNNNNNNNRNNLQLLNLLPTETGEFFKALIRSQDIRSTDRDSVKTWECYQPGDIIRAVVLSLGDGASFYLSTARNDLGVVFARNENGELLYPLDWETMVAPGSGEVEKRKCAKPF
jgi:exosome complex component CSL4